MDFGLAEIFLRRAEIRQAALRALRVKSLSYLGAGGLRSAQAQGVGGAAHCGDAEGDMFLNGNAKFFRAFADVFAIDAAGEGFVF